jgi:hypothetical protein
MRRNPQSSQEPSKEMQKTVEIPVQTRLAQVGEVNAEGRTVPIVWTTGAAVRRMDFWTGERWIEELSTDPKHVRMGRMESGAPLLDTHNRYSLGGVLGVVEDAQLKGGEGTAKVRFSRRADVEPVFQDVTDKIIRNVSVGYQVYRYEDVSTAEDTKARMRRLLAVDWEPQEVSLVPVGADAAAGVRSEPEKHPCVIEFSERSEIESERTAGHEAPPADSGGADIDLLRRKLELAYYEHQ